jgi:hypothetical protein
LPLWFSPSLSWSYEVRLNGERVVSGFEIERWGLEKWHGWWLCRLSLCGRSPKFSWERKLEERVYIYILYFAQEKPDVSSVCSALCYKLDFLFKNLFLTYFLSKIFIKYYINLIKPIQLKK